MNFSKKKLVTPVVMAAVLAVGATPSFAYTVKSGDTLGNIADTHGMNLVDVLELNPQIENPNLIYVGDNVKTNGTAANVNTAPAETTKAASASSSYEEDLLARLVEAEAKGESYSGKVAVAGVVLNRVNSIKFPHSIESVIYEAGQFSPVTSGTINRPASSESLRAAKQALRNGGDGVSMFFYNPAVSGSSWLDTRQTTKVIGNHVFKQ